jgi:membrane protein implicated in regulation of membrane protease activity
MFLRAFVLGTVLTGLLAFAPAGDWLIPLLQFGLPALVALIGGWMTYRSKKKDNEAQMPFKLIQELQEEVTRMHEEFLALRLDQEDCHRERLEQSIEIAQLKIRVVELEAEVEALEKLLALHAAEE